MKRNLLLFLLLLTLATPTTSYGQWFPWSKKKTGPPPLSARQAQWWNANRQQAKYIPGRGYQVPGAAGFFDEQGRPLTEGAGEIVGSLNQDDDPDTGIPIDGNFASTFWNRVTGQEPSKAARTVAYTPVNPPTYGAIPPSAPVTPEQARWWAENRRFSRPIGNGLHQIDGHGVFNEQGQRAGAAPSPTIGPEYGQPGPANPYQPAPIYPTQGATPYGGTGSSPDNTTGESLAGTLAERYSSDDEEDDGFLDMFSLKSLKKVDQNAARQHFAQADEAMRRSDYDTALDGYESAMEAWPDSPLEEDAMFMVGECYFFTDQYPEAFDAYEELLKKYKRSRHLEQAVAREFRIGQYWLDHHSKDPSWVFTPNISDKTRPRLDTLGQARRAFKRVRLNDPTGKLADDSLMMTANSHFTRGDWDDAAYHYTLLVREYPNSPHQYDAHVLGIQSHLKIYQGPAYDKTPLDEADRLMKQVMRQFPQQPQEQRDRLTSVKAQVTAFRAERDFRMAEIYEKQGFVDAARQYYGDVAREYVNTPLGQQANERYAALNGKPGVPVQRFTWISTVFPEEQDQMSNMIRSARAPSAGPIRR